MFHIQWKDEINKGKKIMLVIDVSLCSLLQKSSRGMAWQKLSQLWQICDFALIEGSFLIRKWGFL